jgi:hypothetical protein
LPNQFLRSKLILFIQRLNHLSLGKKIGMNIAIKRSKSEGFISPKGVANCK